MNHPPPPEDLDIAVRAYGVKAKQHAGGESAGRHPGPSGFSLVFDMKSFPDAAQQLQVGAYQWREEGRVREAGLFYDPVSLSKAERAAVGRYAVEHDLEVRTDREFVDEVFYELAYDLNAWIVGFNLPFAISRLAIKHGTAQGNMRGGFTFRLSESSDRPNVRVRHLGNRSALIDFTALQDKTPRSQRKKDRRVPTRRGYFVDVHTVAGALLGASYTLRSMAKFLQTKTRKSDHEDFAGPITPESLDDVSTDPQVIWECFEILAERFAGYGLDKTRLSEIYSEAGIGKACLKEMGVQPWQKVQPGFPPELIGIIMSTYHGGRSEVRIRREVVRVLYLDFLSQFSTSAVLQDLWSFVRAQGIEYEDATDEVRFLLEHTTLEDLRTPDLWKALPALVQVRPDQDLFPVRTRYQTVTEDGEIIEAGQYTTGLNFLTSETPLWFTLADCLASKLLSGKAPAIERALRFGPGPSQEDLQPIDVLGKLDYRVDPKTEDFYKRLVDLRIATKAELERALVAGETQLAERLQAEQQALKTTASASAYGIFVELNVDAHADLQELVCYGPAGSGFPAWEHNVEKPGTFFHPLVATLITGGSRLMLAIAERLAQDQGIGWAFCDTDSIALAAPMGMSDPEFLARAERVRSWFDALNSYEAKDEPLFQVEEENYRLAGGKVTKELADLRCFAVSAKRYCLFNVVRGRPVIRKGSGHGLGHLIPPYSAEPSPKAIPAPVVALDDLDLDRWEYDLWYRIAQAALTRRPELVNTKDLPGFEAPAVALYSAATPKLLGWFKAYNASRTYREQVRPFGFLLAYQADRSKVKGEQLPAVVAPFDLSLDIALTRCFDRESGRAVEAVELRSYRRALAQYHLNPETKFRNADYLSTGETERRHVRALAIDHIGKEANRWEEQFFLGYDPEAQVTFGKSPDDLGRLRSGAMRASAPYGVRELSRASGVSMGAVSGFRRGVGETTEETIQRILASVPALAAKLQERDSEELALIERIRRQVREDGLRSLAAAVGVDSGNLSAILAGRRSMSPTMGARIRLVLNQQPEE